MKASARWAAYGVAAFLAAVSGLGWPAAAVAAAAQPAPAPAAAPAPVDSHEAAARELVRLTDLKHLALQAGGAALDAQVKANPKLEPYADIMHAWVARVFDEIDLEGLVVDLYKEAFTEAELRDLIVFYQTPTGRKALTVMPDLMTKGMAIGMQKAKEHSGELQEMMEKRDKELAAKSDADKPADSKPPR